MRVRLSSFLRDMLEEATAAPDEFGLEDAHLDDLEFFVPQVFTERFLEWKGSGVEDYYFGKDVPNLQPLGDLGEYILHHVHIVPLTNPEDLQRWDKSWDRGSRRTSDTALMYVDGGIHGYLLLTILWEPDAHEVIKMKTPADRKFMNEMAWFAKQFIDTGECDF